MQANTLSVRPDQIRLKPAAGAHRRRARRAMSEATQRVAFDALESRQLFSSVAWTGAGDGANWSDAANWSGGAVPAAADDVTIDVAASPTIQITGARSVHSLSNAESLTLSGGATLTVADTAISSGDITVNGGTISGGNWTFAAGKGFYFGNFSNALNGATIAGDLFFTAASARTNITGGTTFTTAHLSGGQSDIAFAPGSTLSGTVLFEGTNTGNRYIETMGAGVLNIAPTGAIRTAAGLAGPANIGASVWYTGGITLNNAGLISAEASGKALSISTLSTALNNSGTLRAQNGSTLNINSANWTSSGTISATDATLHLAGNWSNTGTLAINNSTLSLDGTFTAAGLNLAGFSRSGSSVVNLDGTLNNASSNLTFNNSTGTWNLTGGTISGGQISFAGGVQGLNFTTGGTLANVAVNGDLTLNTTGGHVAITGNTSFNTLHMVADSTSVGFTTAYTLNDTILFEGAGTGSRNVEFNGGIANALTIGSGGSIRNAAGFAGTASIGSNFWYGNTGTIINNGTIHFDAAGRTLNILGNAFNNATGAIEIANGTLNISPTAWTNAAAGTISANGATVKFANTWSNAGNLSLNNSSLRLDGTFSTAGFNFGAFSRAGTGVIDIAGTMNNASSTLALGGALGAWNLRGGTINGGTISSIDSQTLALTNSGGTLNNVTVSGDIDLDVENAHVKLAGTSTFDTAHLVSNGTSIGFDGGYTLNRPILFEGAGNSGRYVEANGGNGTLTIGPGGSIATAAGFAGTGYVGHSFWYGGTTAVINNGLIRSDVAGRTLQLSSSNFTNNGTIDVSNGTLNFSATNWTNAAAGTIQLAGSTATFSNNWSNPGALHVSNTTLTLDGNFSTSGFNFAGFQRSGGTVNLKATVNNANSTLTLNAATGPWNLVTGTINGGQLSSATAQSLVLTANLNTLNNVTVLGDISLDLNDSRVKLAGTTTFSSLHLAGSNVSAAFDPGYVLNSPIVFEGASTNGRYVELSGDGTLTIGPSGSIKTAAGFAGTGNVGASFWYTTNTMLDIQGLVSSEVSGKPINLKPAAGLTISGTTQVTNGGLINVDTAGPVHITSSGSATVSHFRTGAMTIDGAAIVAPAGNNNGTSIVNGLTFNGAGYIDFNDNDLVLKYDGASPLADVQSMIGQSRNGGAWNGAGRIRSSAARNASPKNTTLAAIDAADYRAMHGDSSSFDGVSVNQLSAVLLKYTYYGDADFNGKVNFDDYVRTDNGFNNHQTGWTNGDFDGNGSVNFDDYVLIDLAFNTQSAML